MSVSAWSAITSQRGPMSLLLFFQGASGPDTLRAVCLYHSQGSRVKRWAITSWCGQRDENLGGDVHTEREDDTR